MAEQEIKLSIENADCIVRHINAFIKQCHYKEAARFGEPCEGCPQAEKCKFDWLANMEPLAENANEKIRIAFPGMAEQKSTIEMTCVFHWLICLYRDFLNKRVAGEQMPCSSCPELERCTGCPPLNFDIAGEKHGLEVFRQIKSKE